jgi:NADH:ubiquinone oxidoreductase subunit 5 (subunit L)/multisubunit Na+/H+ antiporter MnhA subunit
MIMNLSIFIWIPMIGFLVSLILPKKNETLISATAFGTLGIQFGSSIIFVVIWVFQGAKPIQVNDIILFKNEEYVFQIDFLLDYISAVYLLVGALLTFMVTLYSRYYLHREAGYKRFFNTTLFFYVGYCFATLSGNLETLFIGWEILGISSFLLISFYRERYLPVKNAVKVFSIYRIGDVGLMLAMWASHHLWGQNITFSQLNNAELVHEHLMTHSAIGIFISSMFLLSASARWKVPLHLPPFFTAHFRYTLGYFYCYAPFHFGNFKPRFAWRSRSWARVQCSLPQELREFNPP